MCRRRQLVGDSYRPTAYENAVCWTRTSKIHVEGATHRGLMRPMQVQCMMIFGAIAGRRRIPAMMATKPGSRAVPVLTAAEIKHIFLFPVSFS